MLAWNVCRRGMNDKTRHVIASVSEAIQSHAQVLDLLCRKSSSQ